MGLIRAQKEGEGMIIEGRGRSIDITILEVLEKGGDRSRIRLQISGVQGLSELELSARDGFFDLGDDVRIQVCNTLSEFNNQIKINYAAPQDYKFYKKEY